MANSSAKASGNNNDDSGISWVTPKARPKPAGLHADEVICSRESGLLSGKGTFGNSNRFSDKVVGMGSQSPRGATFYSRNRLYKSQSEAGLTCSQGVGDRSNMVLPVPPNVGPGSYEVMASCAMRKSPLDGPEFCNTTMHAKLPSKLVPANMCSPGPHHKYQIARPLDDRPTYGTQLLASRSPSRPARHPYPEDNDGPGLGYNDLHHESVASRSHSRGLKDSVVSESVGGTKRNLKTTFGTADRFRAGKQTCSPVGDLYYAHAKFFTTEDYLSGARSCSFGVSHKTDFSNPHHGHRSTVSPVTYAPIASTVKKTSAMDGFANRCASPVATFSKNASSSKH